MLSVPSSPTTPHHWWEKSVQTRVREPPHDVSEFAATSRQFEPSEPLPELAEILLQSAVSLPADESDRLLSSALADIGLGDSGAPIAPLVATTRVVAAMTPLSVLDDSIDRHRRTEKSPFALALMQQSVQGRHKAATPTKMEDRKTPRNSELMLAQSIVEGAMSKELTTAMASPASQDKAAGSDVDVTMHSNISLPSSLAQRGLHMGWPTDAVSAPKWWLSDILNRMDAVGDGKTFVINKPDGKPGGAVGVKQNAVGDGSAFMLNIGINSLSISICFLLFAIGRQKYKRVFSGNVYLGAVPCQPSDTFFGFFSDSTRYSSMQLAEHVGLDQAMLLEYCNLCMKVLFVIGIPLLLIEAPLNIFAGGNAAGQDHLSWQGMANVDDDRKYIYWFYAVLVWWVVVVTQVFTFGSMKKFIKIRFDWIRVMPQPQAQTIMVENIPKEFRTDQKLRRYFDNVFGERVVVYAHIVKFVHQIHPIWEKRQEALQNLKLERLKMEKSGMRPQVGDGQSDSIDHLTLEIDSLEKVISDQRRQVFKFATHGQYHAEVNSSSAFVIFNSITHAVSALAFNYTEDGDEFLVSVPPQPSDVLYEGLLTSPLKTRIKEIIGYALIVALFLGFLPVILFISLVTEITTIEHMIPAMKQVVIQSPAIGMVWDAMFGSLAVTLMMSFLPTFLMMIFTHCFALKSTVEAQHLCQKWYFLFLVTFVLLVTSVGASLFNTIEEIAKSPFLIFSLLASNMPSASHYYLVT